MTKTIINEPVAVTAVYFTNRRGIKTFPRRIEYQGRSYTFADGIRMLVKRGESVTRLFDMTDGQTNFRLSSDANQTHWTLVAITR